MPITPTNISKNAITPTSNDKGGYATWGDMIFTWGDSIALWGAPINTSVNISKNAITPTNLIKD